MTPERRREIQRKYYESHKEEIRASNRESARRRRAENPEHFREAVRRYYKKLRAEKPEIIRERSRKQYYSNPEAWKRAVLEWQKRNPELARSYKKKYSHSEAGKAAARLHSEKSRTKYPEKHKDAFRRWFDANRAKNPRHVIEYRKTEAYQRERAILKKRNKRRWKLHYRGRKAGADGGFTQRQWMDRVLYYGWRCWMCCCELTPETLTQDHVIPLSVGGSNWPSNLRPACRSCNSRKNNKKPSELT